MREITGRTPNKLLTKLLERRPGLLTSADYILGLTNEIKPYPRPKFQIDEVVKKR